MNTHAINAAELNASPARNAIINLGAAAATLEFVAFERALTLLSGSAGLTTSVLGDLAKMSQIGSATSGITFTESATLSSFANVNIGVAAAGISFSQFGDLYAVVALSDAVTGIDFTTTASLAVRGDLSAETEITFTATSAAGPQLTRQLGEATSGIDFTTAGDLTQHVKRYLTADLVLLEFEATGALTQYVKNYLPAVSAPLSFDVVGTLTNYATLPAATSGVSFIVDGLLAHFIYLQGSSGIDFTVDGDLFNNPNAYDPPENVLYRPYVDRVMVRQ